MSTRTHQVRGSRSTSQRGGGREKRNVRNDCHDFGRESTDDTHIDKQNYSNDNDSRRRGNSTGFKNSHFRGSRGGKGNRFGGRVENTYEENLSIPSVISNPKKIPDYSQNPIFRNHLMARFNQFLPPSNTETELPTENFLHNQKLAFQNKSTGNNFYPEQYSSYQQKGNFPNDSSQQIKNQKGSENTGRLNAKESILSDQTNNDTGFEKQNHRFPIEKSNLNSFQTTINESESNQTFQSRKTLKSTDANSVYTSVSLDNFFQNFKCSPNRIPKETSFHNTPSSKQNEESTKNKIQSSRKNPDNQHFLSTDKKVNRRKILEQYGFFKGESLVASESEHTKSVDTTLPTQLAENRPLQTKPVTSGNIEKYTKPVIRSSPQTSALGSPTKNKEKQAHPLLAGIIKDVVDFNADLINEQKSSAQRNLAARNLKGDNSLPVLYRNPDSSVSDIAGNPLHIVKKVNDTNDRVPSRNDTINKMAAEYEIKQVEHLTKEKEKADKKRQEYLARYEHVDQGHRLYEPYLEEAAGFDPGFLISEEEARFRQQEEMEREAAIFRQKQREQEEREQKREEEKQKQWLQKHRHIDAGYKLGRGAQARTTTERETGHFVTENTPKELPGFHPKTDPKIDECPINPEDFLLEGQTYEEALELQQQLLLATSRFKTEEKEEKQPKFEERKHYYENAVVTAPKNNYQRLVKKEDQNTPVKSETCSDKWIKKPENNNKSDEKFGLKRSFLQADENKSPNKIQKDQSTSSKTSYQSRNILTNQFLSNVDAWEKNGSNPSQLNKSSEPDYQASYMTSEQQLKNTSFKKPANVSGKLAENSNPKPQVSTNMKPVEKANLEPTQNQSFKRLGATINELENTMLRPIKLQETSISGQLANKSVTELEKMIFQQKPRQNNDFQQPENAFSKLTQNTNTGPPENKSFKRLEDMTVKELQNLLFPAKQQENIGLKPQPRSIVVKSSSRGAPTLLIRNSEQALQLAKHQLIDQIDKYGLLVTDKSVDTPVTAKTPQLTPTSALAELGKATGAIPKQKTPVAAPLTDQNPALDINIPAKSEPEVAPVIDFQAEMRAVRQRMQEEYEKSLRQHKENKTDSE